MFNPVKCGHLLDIFLWDTSRDDDDVRLFYHLSGALLYLVKGGIWTSSHILLKKLLPHDPSWSYVWDGIRVYPAFWGAENEVDGDISAFQYQSRNIDGHHENKSCHSRSSIECP